MLKLLKRIMITAIIIGLLVSNVLALTSSAFSNLLSGAIAATTGMKTLAELNRESLNRQRLAVKRIGTRMIARTKRMVARTISSAPIKFIPILGGAVGLSLTVWELAELCEGIQDLDQLYEDLEIDEEVVPLEVCTTPEEP